MHTMRQHAWDEDDYRALIETHSYDINCSYRIHRLARFQQNFQECHSALVARIGKVRDIINEIHMNGHGKNGQECFDLFNGHHMPGMGHNPFESVEQVWAEWNQCGASTRQMSAGHRHDSLESQGGNWNWQKITKIGK